MAHNCYMDATTQKPRGGDYQIMGERACELIAKGWPYEAVRKQLAEEFGKFHEIGWQGPHRMTLDRWRRRAIQEAKTNGTETL